MARYSAGMRLLHWVMALAIIGLLATGLGHDAIDQPLRGQVMDLHKSFGATILALLALRIAFRLGSRVPALPDSMPAIEKLAAKLGVAGFYALMLAMPLSGWLMVNSKGRDVNWFGIADLPALVAESAWINDATHEAHEIGGWVLLALLGVHIGAVIWHRVAHKENLLRRMM